VGTWEKVNSPNVLLQRRAFRGDVGAVDVVGVVEVVYYDALSCREETTDPGRRCGLIPARARIGKRVERNSCAHRFAASRDASKGAID
jgi:hypothetical protein